MQDKRLFRPLCDSVGVVNLLHQLIRWLPSSPHPSTIAVPFGSSLMASLRHLLAAAILLITVSASSQPPTPLSPAIEQRVDALIIKMSLDDKLKLIGGVDGFYTQSIPSIGLKRLKMS